MKAIIQRLSYTVLAAALVLTADACIAGSIRDTKHNLSVSGPGPITATSEDRICIFCHAPPRPRRMNPFLWNRLETNVQYTPYKSSTLRAHVGQPTGASRLCLSCHDGTIAFGALASEPREIAFKGGIRFMPDSGVRLGTDLSDDHPVSFTYDTALAFKKGELRDPAQLPHAVRLDKQGQLQCTACHDPHDNRFGNFMVMPNNYSQLCIACHDKNGWSNSIHASSNARLQRHASDIWPATDYQTVSENGCQNCHRSHSAGRHERLLIQVFEEDNCLVCHDGRIASTDIATQLAKRHAHPVQDFNGVHDAAENFSGGNVPKHVECEDCHNPHQVSDRPAVDAMAVSGDNQGVKGIDAGGQPTPSARYLFEICFKCHADNNVLTQLPISRQVDQLNTRLEFAPGNPSFHPVESPGINPDVPSLLQPLTTSSTISCTDCHNNDESSGPRGPHGSQYSHLLARNYVTLDRTVESADNYALCYQCHSRASILADESFAKHSFHIVEEKTPCSVCHDPHGISGLQQSESDNSHLINFDLSVVQPGANGLFFRDLGRFRGQCALVCHNKAHMADSASEY